MSQWFGGPGRKAGKTPGGSPEGSAGSERGRSGRPPVRPAAQPPRNRPQPNFDDELDPNWGADPAQSQQGGEFSRPASMRPRPNVPPPPGEDWGAPPASQSRPSSQSQYADPAQSSSQLPPQQRPGQRPSQPQPPAHQAQQPPLRPNQQSLQQQAFDQQPQQSFQQPYQQPQQRSSRQGSPQRSQQPQQYQSQGQQYYDDELLDEDAPDTPQRLEFKKRLVALIIDFLACYMLAMTIMLIPYLNNYLHTNLVMSLLLLVRDFPFEGRGIGKNLMGLQVVDTQTGGPPTLKQSALRNLVLMAPYALLQLVSLILHFVPFVAFNEVVQTIVNIIGALYVIIVIPLEVYRAYNRPDGQRIGDELAHTEVIESSMDFSKPLPRR